MKILTGITPREAYANYMLGKAVFIDVREGEAAGRQSPALKNLIRIPLSELESRMNEVPADQPVVFLSWKGRRGHNAAKFLSGKGYANVQVVNGGIKAWKDEGMPVC